MKMLQNSPIDSTFSNVFLKNLSRNSSNDQYFDALVSFSTSKHNANNNIGLAETKKAFCRTCGCRLLRMSEK